MALRRQSTVVVACSSVTVRLAISAARCWGFAICWFNSDSSMAESIATHYAGNPERLVTADAISNELGRSLGMAPDLAQSTMQAVFRVIGETVSEGQINEVRGELPKQMKYLFPTLAA